jgi:hypothetical protein
MPPGIREGISDMNLKTFRSILLAVSAVSALGLTACGGGFSCDAESKCSKDDKRDQADIDSCQKQLDGDCGSEFQAAFDCYYDNQQCTADDKSDPIATSAKCTTEFLKATSCCTSKPTAAGCGQG